MPPKKYGGLNNKKVPMPAPRRKNATKTAPASGKAAPTRKLKASLSTSISAKPTRKTVPNGQRKKPAKRSSVEEPSEPTTQETRASELGPETQEPKSKDQDQDQDEDDEDATQDDGEEASTQIEAAAATAEFLKSMNTSMEARHKVKRQKLQAQHRAAVEKLEKGIREGSRRQAREFAKYRNQKLARLAELIKKRTEVEAKIESSARRIEEAYRGMYSEFRTMLEETIAMAEKGKKGNAKKDVT